ARHWLEREESAPSHDAHAFCNNLLQLFGAMVLGHRRSLFGLARWQHLKGIFHEEPHADLGGSHLDRKETRGWPNRRRSLANMQAGSTIASASPTAVAATTMRSSEPEKRMMGQAFPNHSGPPRSCSGPRRTSRIVTRHDAWTFPDTRGKGSMLTPS